MTSDADRILPGEGSSPVDAPACRLAAINDVVAVAMGLHNPAIWRVPRDDSVRSP